MSSFLRMREPRTLRLIEKSRRFKLRKSLMMNQGLSQPVAKEIAERYRRRRP
jgi:hypothetical protein